MKKRPGATPSLLLLPLTLEGRGWRGEGQVKDEPQEGKEGVRGAEQPMIILLSVYKWEGICVPTGGLHAFQSRQRGADVVRRRGSGDRAERTTSGWENLLLQQGSEHVSHASLQAVQATQLTCLGTLEERSSRLVGMCCDIQYI